MVVKRTNRRIGIVLFVLCLVANSQLYVEPVDAHVSGIAIDTGWDYGEPDVADDLTYEFYFGIETDANVNLVEVNRPAGYIFSIPNDVNTQSGSIQTWHYVEEGIHCWEYEAEFDDIAELDNYGDGNYIVTVHYEGGGTDQTTVWFGIPGTTNPIPQPTQEPILTSPLHNGSAKPPVTFEWEDCYDVNATSIWLNLEKEGTGEEIDINFPVDANSSEPCALSDGIWETELSFDNWYDFNNADGIPVGIGKWSESDYTFTVIGPIVVTRPRAGEEFVRGKTCKIRWTGGDRAANVRIWLYKGSSKVATIKSSTANDGVCSWKVPTSLAVGHNYRIRVKSLAGANADYSDYFSIVKPIVVTRPRAGQIWVKGKTNGIRWTGGAPSSNVRIWLYKGSSVVKTIKSATANDGVCYWTVPTGLAVGHNYRIKVKSLAGANADYSDYFSIVKPIVVTRPRAGQIWVKGKTNGIRWTGGAPSSNVRIWLYKGSSVVKTIKSATANDGVCYWTVPTGLAVGNNYRIKVKSLAGANVDYSDYFSIVEPIVVTRPRAGDQLCQGKICRIRWRGGRPDENVKIRLYKGSRLVRTLKSETANDGAYNWRIPKGFPYSNKYKIRVNSLACANSDYSGLFMIFGPVGTSVGIRTDIYSCRKITAVLRANRSATVTFRADIGTGCVTFIANGTYTFDCATRELDIEASGEKTIEGVPVKYTIDATGTITGKKASGSATITFKVAGQTSGDTVSWSLTRQ